MAAQSAAEEQDQSMEEILQSIKRIIADEGEDEPYDLTAEKRSAGSDVLELTEIVQDDGTVIDAAKTPVNDSHKKVAPKAPAFEEVLVAAEVKAAPQPKKERVSMPVNPAPLDLDTLLSQEVASASAESLRALASRPKQAAKPISTGNSPAFRSGNTVEDLVLESLRPMLKDWLDNNLKGIVEKLVEREVRRIAGD